MSKKGVNYEGSGGVKKFGSEDWVQGTLKYPTIVKGAEHVRKLHPQLTTKSFIGDYGETPGDLWNT